VKNVYTLKDVFLKVCLLQRVTLKPCVSPFHVTWEERPQVPVGSSYFPWRCGVTPWVCEVSSLSPRCCILKRGWGSLWRGEVTPGLITNVWPSKPSIVPRHTYGRVTNRMTHLSLPKITSLIVKYEVWRKDCLTIGVWIQGSLAACSFIWLRIAQVQNLAYEWTLLVCRALVCLWFI